MTERRAARRYDLYLPATVRAPSGTAGTEQHGTTRNVSTRGVYLTLDRPVSRETDIDLTMVLPADVCGSAGVVVRAAGKVVRVDEWSCDGANRVGVATIIRRYEIIRSQPVAPFAVPAKAR